MKEELKRLIGDNEKILYEGKPDKKCFLFESIFNPLLIVAIIWAVFDFSMIKATFMDNSEEGYLYFMIPFLLFHMMPVWLYLGGVLLSRKKHKNTQYIVTDHAVYVSGGIFSKYFHTKPFAEMSHVNLHRGVFDQIFHVGDIILTTNQFIEGNRTATISLSSISDYAEVYKIVSKLQKDIYTDTMYPNDKRPPENHGYQTEYKGLEK